MSGLCRVCRLGRTLTPLSGTVIYITSPSLVLVYTDTVAHQARKHVQNISNGRINSTYSNLIHLSIWSARRIQNKLQLITGLPVQAK